MDLLVLAAEIERYTPSGQYDVDRERRRELNEKIAVAIGLPLTQRLGDPAIGNDRVVPTRIQDYATSLDAAMTLVPKGCQWGVDTHYNMADVHQYWSPRHAEDEGHVEYKAEGSSVVLALCAAALRARASS